MLTERLCSITQVSVVSCLSNIVVLLAANVLPIISLQIIYKQSFQIFMAYFYSLVLNRTTEEYGGKNCSTNHFYKETPSLSKMFFIMSCGGLLRKMSLMRYEERCH